MGIKERFGLHGSITKNISVPHAGLCALLFVPRTAGARPEFGCQAGLVSPRSGLRLTTWLP